MQSDSHQPNLLSNHSISHLNLSELYRTAALTPYQSGEYNLLLSKLAEHLSIIQANANVGTTSSTKTQTDANSEPSLPNILADVITTEPKLLLQNWQALITHLQQVLLPEMYVFFHDDSTSNQERQQLHQYSLKLQRTCQIWSAHLNKNLHDNVAVKPNANNNTANDKPTVNIDNYVVGRGNNAQLACSMLPIAKLSSITGSAYLQSLRGFIRQLVSVSTLKKFLLREHSQLMDDLQNKLNTRLQCFSQPNANILAAQPELLLIQRRHPLITHLLSTHTNPQHTMHIMEMQQDTLSHTQQTMVNPNAAAQSFVNQSGVTSAINQSKPKTEEDDANFAYLFFAAVIMLFNSSLFSMLLMLVFAVILSHVLVKRVNKDADLHRLVYDKFEGYITHSVEKFAPLLLGGSVFYWIFDNSFVFTALSILAALGLSAYQLGTGKILLNEMLSKRSSKHSYNAHRTNSLKHKDMLQGKTHSGAKNTQNPSQTQTNNHSHNHMAEVFIPLNAHYHAKHLQVLLSATGVEKLQKLIHTVNELYEYLDYLQQQHPYLANSVHELIMDITSNSLLRLDQTAKTFVKNGTVKPSAKKLFASKHEPQIIQLFDHHIDEVQALNQSILEKQMAGFSQAGTESERQFRDRVMELKILLRWYIAQQPDALAASAHQVILDSLQNNTLQQMMDVFYQPTTTTTQRQALQQQLDELLEHFKSHSPIVKKQDDATSHLLQLTHQPTTVIDAAFNQEAAQTQVQIQAFIDFNAQYVKQLKQHW